MKDNLKQILRWLTIAIFGGIGVYVVVASLWNLYTHFNHEWFHILLMLLLTFICSLIPLSIADCIYRRAYLQLITLSATVGSILVWGLLMRLSSSGIQKYLSEHLLRNYGVDILGLPLSLLFLFGPFYAAFKFHDLFIKIAVRYFHVSMSNTKWTSK